MDRRATGVLGPLNQVEAAADGLKGSQSGTSQALLLPLFTRLLAMNEPGLGTALSAFRGLGATGAAAMEAANGLPPDGR